MDITLTADKTKATQHVMDAVDCALVLTNDYYSFDREYAAVKSNPEARIVNGIFLLMLNDGIDEAEAKSSKRDLIVEYESQFLVRWKEYQEKNTNMSMNLRRFIEEQVLSWPVTTGGVPCALGIILSRPKQRKRRKHMSLLQNPYQLVDRKEPTLRHPLTRFSSPLNSLKKH